MRILVVSPYMPSPMSGASTRSYYLLKALASQHSISLVTIGHSAGSVMPSDISLLEHLAHPVQVIVPPELSKRWQQLLTVGCGKSYVLKSHFLVKMQEALDALVAREHYDAVFYESALMADYRLPEGVKIIIDQHNIEHELRLRTYEHEKAWVRKWYNWLEGHLIKPIEIERCRRAAIVLVPSERERLVLKRLQPSGIIEVVPNGVDIEAFQKSSSIQEVLGRIIFTGSMDYYPNVHAVLFFAQKVWPLIRAQIPTATWHIVGKNPLPEVQRLAELAGITVTGSVPNMHPYLAEAEVAIAPLLIGGGTRLKILEALAMQKAVVSTSLGCEGLSVMSGKHLIVADEPEAFAGEVVALLNNPERRSLLGNAGRALVESEYSWERCGASLLEVLKKHLLGTVIF